MSIKKTLPLLLALAMLLSLLPLSAPAASGDIYIFVFEDIIFKDWVIDTLNLGNEIILPREKVLSVTSIDISELHYVSNLAGIEVFENLERLDCKYNRELTSLDLSGNPKLRELDCSDCGLTSLNVSGNRALEKLDCSSNKLTALDLSGNPNLRKADCDTNRLETLDLSGADALEILNCDDNSLTALDLSGNPKLERLWCYNNRLTALDLSGNPLMKNLACFGNQISELDLSGTPLLLDLVKGHEPEVWDDPSGVPNVHHWGEGGTERGLSIDGDTKLLPDPDPAPELPASYKDKTGWYDIANGQATFVKTTATNATSVKIPDTITVNGTAVPVTAIGPGAFRTNQKKLTKVTIGKNVREIGKNAFFKCTKLKSVSGGANVEIIGGSAFQGCAKLTKFTIGAKVKEIGKSAFNKCPVLKKITIKSTLLNAKTVGANAFKGIHPNATVKVPKAVKKEYTKWLLKKGIKKTMKIK